MAKARRSQNNSNDTIDSLIARLATLESVVSVSYHVSANFAATASIPINYDTKIYDPNNYVTTSPTAWKFTAPVAGKYLIVGSGGASNGLFALVFKNGSAFMNIGAVSQSAGQNSPIQGVISLNAGDFIDIRPNGSSTVIGGALNATNGVTNIQITRIGN